MANLQLTGTYERTGSKLIKGSEVLRICTRKKQTPNKPAHFLVYRTPGTRGQYISSLYQDQDSTYHFDYQGQKYEMSIQGHTATIVFACSTISRQKG